MWTKLTVGSEIAAYWEEYQNYYPCKLIERGAKPGWFRAEYDSGEIEWHDMKAMKFRWQQDPIEEEFAEDHEDDCSDQYEDEVHTHNSNTEPDDDDDLDADLLEEEEEEPLTKKGRGSRAKASTTRSTGTRGDRGRKRSDTSNDDGKSSRSTKRTKTEDVDDDQRNNGNNDDDTQNEGQSLIEKSILLQTPKHVMTMSLQSQKKGPLLRSVNNKIDSKSNDSAMDDKGNGTRDEEDDQGSELLSNDDDDDDDDNDEDYVHKESDEEDDEEDEEYCDDEGVIEKVKKGKKKSAIKKVVNKKPTEAGVTKPILNIVEEGNVRKGDHTVLNEESKSEEIKSNQKKAHVKSESGCDDTDVHGDTDGKSIEYNNSINIKKETTPKKLVIMDDNYVVSTSGMQSRLNNKQVKKAHDKRELTKADALLYIMVNFHMSGLKEVAFKKVYTDLGFKPNNKAINIAWKKLGEEEYVEEVKNKKEKVFQLTAKGMVRAAPDDYVHQLANPPTTTQELHRRIKSNAVNEYGAQTFELLLENGSMTTKELAEKIGIGTSGHKFFYGFRQLKLLGYVIKDPNNNLSWSLSREKAFVK